MRNAVFTVYPELIRNRISPGLFGHFTEHAGDILYGSVFDPASPLADENGLREDVCAAVREAGPAFLRYPGGNFVSNYHWEDGIGERSRRPKVFDYAWLTEDDNRMGTVEFIHYCRKVGAEPYICVNMGSGTAEEAMHWVEFCNGTKDTKYANLRRSLGYEEPFGVRLWGLGNEMYGDWQFGSCDALTYVNRAKDFAKAMKWADPSIELVAAGYDLDSAWNSTVARVLGPLISHVAIHHYSIGYGVFDEADYGQCLYIGDYLKKLTEAAHASVISGTNDALTPIRIAWDEWNTHAWNQPGQDDEPTYSFRNALLTASILHAFLHLSDKVELAAYSPFVGKCGALHVTEDGILKRAQYTVFEYLSRAFADCDLYVTAKMECETHALPEVIDFSNRLPEPMFSLDAKSTRRTVETAYVDGVAAISADGETLVLSILNKHPEEPCLVRVGFRGAEADWAHAQCSLLYHEDMDAYNRPGEDREVVMCEAELVEEDGVIRLPEHALGLITIPLLRKPA